MMTREFAPHSRGLFGFGNSLRELFNTPRQLSEILIHGKPLSDEERAENQRRYYAQVKAENERLENERLEKRNRELKQELECRNTCPQPELPIEQGVELKLVGCTLIFRGEETQIKPNLASILQLLWDEKEHQVEELITETSGSNYSAKDMTVDMSKRISELNRTLRKAWGGPPRYKWITRISRRSASRYCLKKPC